MSRARTSNIAVRVPDPMLGARVKKQRERKRMTQTKLAARVRVSYQMIGRYEKGTTSMTVEMLQAIAAALEVSPLFFLDPDQQAPTNEVLAELMEALHKIVERIRALLK